MVSRIGSGAAGDAGLRSRRAVSANRYSTLLLDRDRMVRFQSPFLRYISALGLPAAALIVAVLLRRVVDPNFFLPFVAAVFLAAWFHGLGVALLATLVSDLGGRCPRTGIVHFCLTGIAWSASNPHSYDIFPRSAFRPRP